MGRNRTVHLGLPDRMSRDCRTQGLRYRRPDNGRHVYLSGVPEDQAIALAERLNVAFGVRPPRGMNSLFRIQFQAYRWATEPRELIELAAVKLADIMPMQRGIGKQEEIRHSWAYAPADASALRQGLKPLPRATTNWVLPLFNAARKNAVKREIPFELTIEDLRALIAESGGRCTVTGITLSNERGTVLQGQRMRRPWAPSIDRIDSKGGYSRQNCRLVCCAANYAMSQWGEAVLLEMAKAMARKRISRLA